VADGLEDRKCEVWVPRPISDVPPCEKVLVLEVRVRVRVRVRVSIRVRVRVRVRIKD
jgi:hypothetical protein